MALYKFAAGLRVALYSNRIWSQQHATLKQSMKEKLKHLNIPDKPKKPLSPYFRFLKDNRESIVQKLPNVKVTDIIRQAAADWANVKSDVKDKYTNEYKQEMTVYNKDLSEYTSKLTPEQKQCLSAASKEKAAIKKHREIKKKLRENDKPKRPVGPYMQFLIAKSKENHKAIPELMHELKGQWQTMSDSDKKHYVQLYGEDKKRYENRMRTWEQQMINEGHTDLVRKSALQSEKSPGPRTAKPRKQ